MATWHPRLTGDKWYPAEESAQRLAESVDAGDAYGPWTTIAAGSGHTSDAEARTAPGGKIEMRGTLTSTSGDLPRNSTIGTLPVGVRPGTDRRVAAVIGVAGDEGPGVVSLVVQTSGALVILSGAAYIDGTVLYLDGAQIPT